MSLLVLLFPCHGLLLVLYKEINIVEAVDETVLLIAIDIEVFLMARREIGHCLIGEVYLYLSFWIVPDTLEYLIEEGLTDDNRQNEVVEFIILVDVSKEAADDHPEAIAGDGPCSVLTGGT